MGNFLFPAVLLIIIGTLPTILSLSPWIQTTIMLNSSTATATATSSYGQPCSTRLKCDSRARLGCHNDSCDCIAPNQMVYEVENKKCVSKSGESCIVAVKNTEDSNYVFHVMDCVSNANCSAAGTCECGSRFFENANGTCSPALGHLETCESEAQCSKYQALHCRDGTCRCDESVAVYFNDLKENQEPTCAGLAQKPCINSACTKNATCSENTCTCTEEFYPDKSGFCVPKVKLLGNCTESSQCVQSPGQELVCLKGICNCNPDFSILSTAQESRKYTEYYGSSGWYRNQNFYRFVGEHLTQCVGIADSPCIDERCTTNAFCSFPTSRTEKDQRGTCKCQTNYIPTRSHTCATGYLSECTSSSTCMDDLVCRNFVCKCPYRDQIFNETRKTCLSDVGGPCKDDNACRENAECNLLPNGSIVGHCSCKDGFVEDSDGSCDVGYGTSCSAASDCDAIADLECIDKKCKCPTFSEYNFEQRKCVGLVGAKCDLKEQSLLCTPDSFCKPGESPRLQGRCACSPEFEETSNYTCVRNS